MMNSPLRSPVLPALAVFLLAGCTAKVAVVPPPPADVIVPPRPSPERSDLPQLGHRQVAPKPETAQRARQGDLVARFRGAYARAGKPRILILVNEVLERDFEDYRTGARWVWQDHLKAVRSDALGSQKLKMDRKRSLGVERRISKRKRLMPSEWGVARAQEVFFDPFRQAGVHLTDPDVAIRAYANEVGPARSGRSSRDVEFSAWRKYADVLVELLFIPDFGKKNWRVTAKAVDLRSGRNLSYVTSYDKDAPKPVRMPGAPASVMMGERDTRLRRSLRATLKMMGQMASAWGGSAAASASYSRPKPQTGAAPPRPSASPPPRSPAEKEPVKSEESALFEKYVDKYLKDYKARLGI